MPVIACDPKEHEKVHLCFFLVLAGCMSYSVLQRLFYILCIHAFTNAHHTRTHSHIHIPTQCIHTRTNTDTHTHKHTHAHTHRCRHGTFNVDVRLGCRHATHCNTLQHTATHRNTLQHTATHCNTPHVDLAHVCIPAGKSIQCRALLIEYKALLTDLI